MTGRKLRRFQEYRDKILTYAKACDLKVRIESCEEDEAYLHGRRTLKIHEDQSESAMIASLLHECGHFMDFQILGKSTLRVLGRANHAIHETVPTRKQKAMVLLSERRAWDLGRVIARQLKIPLGAWYCSEEVEALKSYRAIPSQRR